MLCFDKMATERFAVLLCAEDSEYVKEMYGGYFKVFTEFLREERKTWDMYRVAKGEFPRAEEGQAYDGFVITGSCYDAHGDEEWIHELIDLLDSLDSLKKVLGTCFGHQEIQSLVEYTRIFLEALKLFIEKHAEDIGNLTFDKDDQLAVEFVTAAANIRESSFGIPLHSLFEAKGIAGNIVHAVATTNVIIAGLIVIEAMKVLKNNLSNYRDLMAVNNKSVSSLYAPGRRETARSSNKPCECERDASFDDWSSICMSLDC